jgi:hypothetical protein
MYFLTISSFLIQSLHQQQEESINYSLRFIIIHGFQTCITASLLGPNTCLHHFRQSDTLSRTFSLGKDQSFICHTNQRYFNFYVSGSRNEGTFGATSDATGHPKIPFVLEIYNLYNGPNS